MLYCTSEAEASVLEAKAGLGPLTVVGKDSHDFAECFPDFFVKVSQRVCLKMSWDHSHAMSDFAYPSTISEKP